MLRKLGIYTVFLLTTVSCHDEVTQVGETDSQQRAVTGDILSPDVQIVQLLPDITVDAWVDPCLDLANTDDLYCDCNPTCCQRQTWYCPPTGTEIQAKYAILDICGEDLVPCDRNNDPNCPPAEIIEESACTHAFDCPPGINEDFTMYYDCEIEGVPGRQEVRCDKGRLFYDECVTCYETEEVCNGEDDDCDGVIDENQLNACGGCGQVPEDICDGLDNDCDNTIDEELVRECSTICNSGIEACISGNWIGCTAQRPVDEECDGEDNDCDGLVDEGLNCQCPPEMVGALVPCLEPPLSCGMGFKTCECVDEECQVTEMTECFALCHWLPEDPSTTCDPLVGMPVEPEVCNAFDEDCDSLFDEQLTRACYTGPEGTLGIGTCAPGQQVCNMGDWYGQTQSGNYIVDICGDETIPAEEICDGADNDCDGTVDFGEEIPDTDILFIVDWSGSMENYINAVRMAMNRFAQNFEAEDKLKWGLIVGPKPGNVTLQQKDFLVMESNITDFDIFLRAFASVGTFQNSTSLEMLKDAMLLAIANISGNVQYNLSTAVWSNNTGSVPSLDQFKINWRQGADRIMIVFTDEYDQSYLVPRVDRQVLVDALSPTPNLTTYVFAQGSLTWSSYASATGGQVFRLTSNQQQIYNDLMSILDEICLGSGDSQTRSSRAYSGFLPASYGSQYDYELGLCF